MNGPFSTGWKRWYFERLLKKPSKARTAWLFSLDQKAQRTFIGTFLSDVFGERIDADGLDWTRIRHGHLALLGCGGLFPRYGNISDAALKRAAFIVEVFRSRGGLAGSRALIPIVGAMSRSMKARSSNTRREKKVFSEKQFQHIVSTATEGLPTNFAAGIVAGMYLMYYCGMRPNSLSKLYWNEVMTVRGCRMIWTCGQLIALPRHVDDALASLRAVTPPTRKQVFSNELVYSLEPYAPLADTMRALRKMRG